MKEKLKSDIEMLGLTIDEHIQVYNGKRFMESTHHLCDHYSFNECRGCPISEQFDNVQCKDTGRLEAMQAIIARDAHAHPEEYDMTRVEDYINVLKQTLETLELELED